MVIVETKKEAKINVIIFSHVFNINDIFSLATMHYGQSMIVNIF